MTRNLNISDKAFSHLSGLNLPEHENLFAYKSLLVKKDHKQKGFFKKKCKSVNVTEKCGFGKILDVLKGRIVMTDELGVILKNEKAKFDQIQKEKKTKSDTIKSEKKKSDASKEKKSTSNLIAANKLIYTDKKLNISIIFNKETAIAFCRKKCRNNVQIKIVKNKETEYFKHVSDFLHCGNIKILLVCAQNIQKDEEVFISPDDFYHLNEQNVCACSSEDLCLFSSAAD